MIDACPRRRLRVLSLAVLMAAPFVIEPATASAKRFRPARQAKPVGSSPVVRPSGAIRPGKATPGKATPGKATPGRQPGLRPAARATGPKQQARNTLWRMIQDPHRLQSLARLDAPMTAVEPVLRAYVKAQTLRIPYDGHIRRDMRRVEQGHPSQYPLDNPANFENSPLSRGGSGSSSST